MLLSEIIIQKKKDLEELKRRFPLHRLSEAAGRKIKTDKRSFLKAISNPKDLNLVCELKKASPSAGILREDFQPLRLAGIYEYGGAAAISVLTESRYFKGRPSYLKTIRQVTTLPLLRKDFIFEKYQIYESALLEADAFLLIASLLTENELAELIDLGLQMEMDALIEVHHDEDLKKAMNAGAQIIGINNRDLKTFRVDPERAMHLIPKVPKGIPIIVESGFSSHEELMSYKSLGVNSFLIGTVLMKSDNVLRTIESLLGTDRKWRQTEE